MDSEKINIFTDSYIIRKVIFFIKDCVSIIKFSEMTNNKLIRKYCRTDKKIRSYIYNHKKGVTPNQIQNWKAISYQRKNISYHGLILDLDGKNGVWVKVYAPKKNKNVGKEFCIRHDQIFKKQPFIENY